MGRFGVRTAIVIVLAAAPHEVGANAASAALRERASRELYNLDRDQAIATFREATIVDPNDAAAYRGLASALWLGILLRRGSMTVDDYLGRVSRGRTAPVQAPADVIKEFREALDRAQALARTRLQTNPRDADAHYEVGAAVGLRASYIATVEQSTLGAFRAAKEAYDEHEKVLNLDPRRRDAGLIVGTYRYVVAALALPLRWVAYVAGFGGGRERGLQLIEGAASYPGENQEDARFALILIYNREKRYDDALRELSVLRERYPRNRLVWLETGATNLRAGRAAEAERIIEEGMRRFAGDTRQRMFGENALWHYKRGSARAALGRTADARQDFTVALKTDARKWVYGRTHLELGKLSLKEGNRPGATAEFSTAISLCESDNDAPAAEEARRLMQ